MTGLLHLTLTGQEVRKVRLPRGMRQLELVAPNLQLAVQAVDDGRWLRLIVSCADAEVVIPSGLRGVREVVLDAEGTLSGACPGALKNLQELWILWRRPPGRLIEAARLAGLTELAVVELGDGYGLEADTLPDLPSLTHLSVSGLRRSIVPALKARYRGSAVQLVVRGAKNDAWLAANLSNPFRDWVDDDARGGAAACKAYAAAVRAIDKLPPAGPERVAGAEKALRVLVDALNGIDDKYEMIDTLRREEAAEVFLDLATRADVPPAMADQWIDEWRDF